jgi:hypothetical protein
MKIQIRHKISETYEEIYEFSMRSNSIKYCAIWQSRRDDENDVWGYDWSSHYEKEKEEMIQALFKKLGIEDITEIEDWDYEDVSAIKSRFNPVMQRTKEGKPRLGGMFSARLKQIDPPKIPEKELIEMIKQEIMKKFETIEII